ncbi:MAG: hypothetical protein ACTSP9_05265 [Promethearchaeota archaeon]
MKKQQILFTLIVILLIYSINITIGNAYPGDGDCQDYHTITPIEVPIDNSANIILDGVANEEFWSKPENQIGRVIIPLASIRYDSDPPDLVMNLTATFIVNVHSLYILCQWEDNTTSPEVYVTDGLLFCWDINVINFSAYYPFGMSTEHMGGGRIDSWKWHHHTSISSGLPSLCEDDCFQDDGWVDPNPELSQVNAAFTYVTNVSYTLEISRSIVTNEEYDVQFNENKGYLFNMAIYDNDLHENHAMSWTYSLDLDFGTIPPAISGYITIIMVITMIGIIAILQKKRLKIIE